jgi:1-acyl-sn-glycerol-3-phosphate acyltransferase
MGNFFVNIYNFFEQRKILLYLSLAVLVAAMAYFAVQIKFEENITRIFPSTKNSENIIKVFDNLQAKNKIVVMFSGNEDKDVLIYVANQFKAGLEEKVGGTHIRDIFYKVDNQLQKEMMNRVYDNLPLLLTEEDYTRIDSLFSEEKIAGIMQKNYSTLLSPGAIVLRDYIMRDPLGIGGTTLKHLQDFQLEASNEIYNDYIFSKDGSTLLMMISPVFDMGNTNENSILVEAIEEEISRIEQENTIDLSYFGGPSVAVYNASQIKKDTMITLTIAMIIIVVFISLVFKQKRTIPLLLTPVAFGALFALFLIYLIKGSISSIAVGAGSVVLGIALSYSIHIVAHQNHVSSIRQLIRELAQPLTIGSFTTICAFLGLLLTSSELLQDFGLFASLSLIGTTIFCLIYLPHFLKPAAAENDGKILRFIERFNAYRFDKNKWIVGGLCVLTIICLFTYKNVTFDDDMMALNFEPKHIKDAENKLFGILDSTQSTIYFVSTGNDMQQAIESYNRTNRKLQELKEKGIINNFASANRFIISDETKRERLQAWNDYWTDEKKEFIASTLKNEGAKFRFKETAFEPFIEWLNTDYSHLLNSEELFSGNYLGEFKSGTDDFQMLISQVQLNNADKDEIYELFINDSNLVIFDRAHFTKQWVSNINDDFYLVLFISSFLVFFGLLISFGRLELTLISFLPMLISWIIIIGIMGMFGIHFNIVSIILSTFIFGIGDDFSIFIMDGLQNKYRTGKEILNSHKTAIFFSAFTIIVGMGSLAFAKHPALQSISWMSILGMIIVVLVSFTIQPIIFRWFITNPTSKGQPPYTLLTMLGTLLTYSVFLIGCSLATGVMFAILPLPVSRKIKNRIICNMLMYACRLLYVVSPYIKLRKININKKTFENPSVIVANHQSFIDIVTLLSLSPKIIMMTNAWVYNSPIFGQVIRYVGYSYIGDGIDDNLSKLEAKVKEGYSIVVFPEGTRSTDGKIKRFKKGAFYLAERLKLDILPIVLYGTGHSVSKLQPFYLKSGIVAVKALSRISSGDSGFGTYQEKSKKICSYFRKEYAKMCEEYNVPQNAYFYQRLVQNYIYKGPVLEWYVRIKVKMEKSYEQFHNLIPRQGQITDIGCGYGMLGYMLQMYVPERKILGVDYDEDKIEVARNGFLANDNIHFVYANALTYDYPHSDVFVLNDMLHYMSYEEQETLIKKCASLLNPTGMIIIRDGNKNDEEKQKMTKLTEILSTKIFKFNKTEQQLCFTSDEKLAEIAGMCNMTVESYKNDKYTSNTVWILRGR